MDSALHVVALCSPSRTGKDTFFAAAERLGPEFGYAEVTRVAFADSLKDELVRHFGPPCDREALDGPDKEHWRPLMKAWSEARKYFQGEDYWARVARTYLEYPRVHKALLVFTDLSFQIEKDVIESSVPRESVRYVRLERRDPAYSPADPGGSPSDWGRANLAVDSVRLNAMTPDSMDAIVRETLKHWA